MLPPWSRSQARGDEADAIIARWCVWWPGGSHFTLSRVSREVWTETADAHARPIAVNACSPSRRKVRADLPAPPLTANTRFPAAARPPTARASPAPCFTPRGRIRAPHEPLHGRSLSVRAPRASTRTPHVSPRRWLTKAKEPPSRSAARAESRDLGPLRPFGRTSTFARPAKRLRVPFRVQVRGREIGYASRPTLPCLANAIQPAAARHCRC